MAGAVVLVERIVVAPDQLHRLANPAQLLCRQPVRDFLRTACLAPFNRGLADEIAARLRSAILLSQLGPGERLREEELAASMGVSRGPIREAFVLLERQGLVVIRRNRGAYVARLSQRDVGEVYTLRLAIERLAVERAIEHADAEQLGEMQRVIDRMAAAVERGITEQEAAELDVAFHEIIYRASDHRRLYAWWADLRSQIHIMLLSRNVADADFRDQAVSSHQGILDAIRERNAPRAVALIEEHLTIAYDRVMQSYAQQRDDNSDDLLTS